MVISLPERSEYYYTNIFIPISIDSTILKVAKVSGFIFLGLVAFFLDCAFKLLAYRNITQEKKSSDLSDLVKNTLDKEIQDTPIVEQISTETDEYSENLAAQEKLLETDPLSLVKSSLGNTEEIQDTPIVEQIPIEMPTDKYSMNLAVQKKTLVKYLNKTFRVTPEDFLQNLKLFVVGKPMQSKVEFGEGPLAIHEHLVKVMETVLNPSNELCNDYKEYTNALRAIILTEEYKSNKYEKLSQLTQELCFSKFMGTVLTGLEEEILTNTIGFDSLQSMTPSNISKLIEEGNKILHKQRKTARQSILLYYEKARNAAGINSDQLCSANIPELRSIHKVKQDAAKPYDVYYIRYPTPTIETKKSFCARFRGDNATTIAPEFIGFLDSVQRKNMPFLYVNHQYMDKKDNGLLLSADNNRAEAIQRLEDTHTVFHFLSLPFDGPIVKKIGEQNLEDWKRSLVDALIKEKKGFKLPKKFKESATSKEKEIKKLLDNLQDLYFPEKSKPNKKKLNETERRVLLVIFYSYLKEYFKSEYQIRVMASVCKDNKDRGNVSACIDEALFNLRLEKENEQKALKYLHLRILSPFIFRNEGIVEHRLEFLTDLLNHISTLGDDQKEKIRAFKVNEQYQVIDQWIPRSNEDIRI